MDLKKVVIDPIHVFINEKYKIKEPISSNQYQIVKCNDTDELFYLIKKGEDYDSDTKPSFIYYIEKSFELIHPAIINLSGYSFIKPYFYYKCCKEPVYINNTLLNLSDENVQNILIGVASGLSYLLSKKYYISNFSIKTVILDELFFPKLIDYINFTDINSQTHEKEMIKKYSEFVQEILNKKIQEDPMIPINDRLQNLIERCNQEENIPTFKDFIDFFKSDSYRGNLHFYNDLKCQRYFRILNFEDLIIYDDLISKKHSNCEDFDSIEQICYYFYNNRSEIKELNEKQKFMLNSLPEFYIKKMVKFCLPLTEKLKRYLYNDDLTEVIPNWEKLDKSNSFQLYKELIKQITKLEKQKKEIYFVSKKVEEIEYKIEAIRIKAIELLKDASKQSDNPNAKIELAVQYIKGELLPYNLEKAQNILKSISTSDVQIKKLIKQMKKKVKEAIDFNVIEAIPVDHFDIFHKAEKDDIISMLYIAFSLFTGFKGFQILRSFAIQYYRKAANLSPNAMTILGFLYLNGIFFPRNLKRARNCFIKAMEKGCLKAEIVDCLLRKHVWRTYLLDFDINDLFKNYLPTFSSRSFNDSLAFAYINYILAIGPYLEDPFPKKLIELKLKDSPEQLKSDNEIHSMELILNEEMMWNKKFNPVYTEKILSFPEEKDDPLTIGKSYYYGLNNYPVNYQKAAKFIKISADSGNSEAQWRIAIMYLYSIGINYDLDAVKNYLAKSSEQDNKQGKFYYDVFLKNEGISPPYAGISPPYAGIPPPHTGISPPYKGIPPPNIEIPHPFMLKEKYDDYLDAFYYFGSYFEKCDLLIVASHQGHIDSFLRLINIYENQSEKELFERSLNLSVGLLNETTLIKLIHIFDKNENYKQSNILIQVGMKLNRRKFDYYYFDHLMYGKGISQNTERAKKLIMLAIKEYDPQLIPDEYICLMLQAYAINNEHENALGFLLKYQERIN